MVVNDYSIFNWVFSYPYRSFIVVRKDNVSLNLFTFDPRERRSRYRKDRNNFIVPEYQTFKISGSGACEHDSVEYAHQRPTFEVLWVFWFMSLILASFALCICLLVSCI